MHSTQLIYEAWRNTPRPIIYNTSDGKGNPIQTECNFVDPLQHKNYDSAWKGECLICGKPSAGGIPSKKMLGDSYTDWSRHKVPESDHICTDCAFTMLLNTESNRCTLFRYSFIAEKILHICNRAEMRDYILNPPEPPFVMVCTVSQKKHLAIKSRVSYNRERFFCMLEEECIEVDRSTAATMINLCEALRGIGFTKDEIAKGVIRYDKIKQYGGDAYEKINRLLQQHRETRLFELCLFISQKMNEEEALCYLDLTPKTKLSHPEPYLSTQCTGAGTSSAVHPDTTCGTRSKDSQEEPQSEQMTLGIF